MKLPKSLEISFRAAANHVNKHKKDRSLVMHKESGLYSIYIVDPKEYDESGREIAHLISGKAKEMEYFCDGIYKILHYIF